MSRVEAPLVTVVYRWSAVVTAAGIATWLAIVYAQEGAAGLHQLGQFAVVSLLVLGKFVIFSGLHGDTPSPWTLALLVWTIDLAIGFSLGSGLEKLESAPVLGAWLRRMRWRAMRVLVQYPGLERMAFFGVVTFVLLPLASTGAITGSFSARLVGLNRLAGVAAIALGSAGTSLLFASLAQFLGDRAEDLARSPLLVVAGLVVVALLGRMAYRRVMGRLRAPHGPGGRPGAPDRPGASSPASSPTSNPGPD